MLIFLQMNKGIKLFLKKASGFNKLMLSLIGLVFLAQTQIALATPPFPTLQEQINQTQKTFQEAKAELEQLDQELEIAVENYNAAKVELEITQSNLAKTKLQYESAQKKLQQQQEIFNQRIRSIYVEGDRRYLSVLLNTTSFFDFLTRLRFLSAIAENDSQLIENLKEAKIELKNTQDELEKLQNNLARLNEELETKKMTIEMELLDKQRYVESLSHEVQVLLEAEAALSEQEREHISEKVNSLLEELNILIEPGSVVETALCFLGIPYVWGGEDPAIGFDCSGLVKYVFAIHGIEVPHYSGSQFQLGEPVNRVEDLRPGDLVFFGNPIHHVGIYIDKGFFIHAPQSGDFVRLGQLSERLDYTGARRIAVPPRGLLPPLINESEINMPTPTFP